MPGYEIPYEVPEGWGIFGLENVNLRSRGLQWPTLRMPKIVKNKSRFNKWWLWFWNVLWYLKHDCIMWILSQALIYEYFIVWDFPHWVIRLIPSIFFLDTGKRPIWEKKGAAWVCFAIIKRCIFFLLYWCNQDKFYLNSVCKQCTLCFGLRIKDNIFISASQDLVNFWVLTFRLQFPR